jgi:hypothetical protein
MATTLREWRQRFGNGDNDAGMATTLREFRQRCGNGDNDEGMATTMREWRQRFGNGIPNDRSPIIIQKRKFCFKLALIKSIKDKYFGI